MCFLSKEDGAAHTLTLVSISPCLNTPSRFRLHFHQTAFSESPSTSRVTLELTSHLDTLLSLLIQEAAPGSTTTQPSPRHGPSASKNAHTPLVPSTGPCFEYLLKNDILSTLVADAASDTPPGSLKLTIQLISRLTASMPDTFLAHSSIHKALLKLLRACVLPDGALPASTGVEHNDQDLVQLMTTVSSRIKAYPDLLPIFFRPAAVSPSTASAMHQRVGSPTPSQTSSHAGTVSSSDQHSRSRQAEFLLFSFLLRFVHKEGQTGDLARLGLLHLIQVAFSGSSSSNIPLNRPAGDRSRQDQSIIELSASSRSQASTPSKSHEATLLLAEWLLDSDFAEVLGAGLGALYGLLPSKVTGTLYCLQGQEVVFTGDFVDQEEQETPTGTGTLRRMRSLGREELDAEETTSQRVTFLSLLDFTQEVLDRCSSTFIVDREKQLIAANLRDNILYNVKAIFLDAVLYPSVVESSEADGSALALLTYLTDALDTTRGNGELASTLLDYLKDDSSIEGTASAQKRATKSKSKLNRRKSSALLLIQESSTHAEHQTKYNVGAEERFNLRDILMQNLDTNVANSSKQHQVTQAAAFRLLDMLIRRHEAASVSVLNATVRPNATNFPPRSSPADESSIETDEEDNEDFFVYPSPEQPKGPSQEPTPSAQLVESVQGIQRYLDLANSIQSQDASAETAYERHLGQAAAAIASNPSFQQSLGEHATSGARLHGTVLHPRSSPLIRLLLHHLAYFFTQAPAVNLALTSCLSSLAACPTRSLTGWMVPPEEDDEHSGSTAMEIYERLSKSLQELRQSGEIEEDLDKLLEERKKSFALVDDLADALLEDGAADVDANLAASASAFQSAGLSATTSAHVDAATHPFAAHYAKTARIKLMPPVASTAAFEAWHSLEASVSDEEEEVESDEGAGQYARRLAERQHGKKTSPRMVSLSMLLDNMSVFEESVKELTAIIQVRKTCGIDSF